MPTVDPLPPKDELSHYGTEIFKDAPPEGHPGLSLCWGRHSPEAMVYAVTGRTARRRRDRVRHTTVRQLTSAGFLVRHNPTRRNLFHVTVSYPGNWDSVVAEQFDSCFPGTSGNDYG